jgi:endonuclease/exonuclease/phosphatase family metal-dependent hydrolase
MFLLLDPIYSCENPDFFSILFGYFIPVGYTGIWYSLVTILVGIMLNILPNLIYRRAKQEEPVSLKKFGQIYLYFMLFSVLYLPFLLFSLILITIQSLITYKKIFKIPNSPQSDGNRKKSVKELLKRLILGFFALINTILVLFYIFLAKFVDIEFSTWASILILIGLICGLICAVKTVPLLKSFNYTFNSKKVHGALILGSILFISIIASNLFRPHPDLSIASNSTSNSPTVIKIMSYNIRYDSSSEKHPLDNWENRKPYLASYIKDFDLDIIGVQEAMLIQMNYLISNMNNREYTYTGFGRDDAIHSGEHSAIIYDSQKYQFIDGDTFWLSDTPNFPSKTWDMSHHRVCTWARLEDKDSLNQFFVFCTHYGFGDEFDIGASQLISNKIVELTGDYPVILLGDFNMRNTSIGFPYINGTGVKPMMETRSVFYNGSAPHRSSYSLFTPEVEKKGAQIDFIFASKDVTVLNSTIDHGTYERDGTLRTTSDHYPVTLDCEIN